MVTPAYKPLPSWLNSLIARYQCSDLPAKYSFWQWTKRAMSKRVVRHYFANRPFDVPWDQWCFWLEKGPANYYPAEIVPFTDALNELEEPFNFIDLGADIGAVSLAVRQHCPQLAHLIAVEPNPFAYNILRHNVDGFAISGITANVAVSDYVGKASLCFDPALVSDHEGSIHIDDNGDIEVTTLDELAKVHGISPDMALALKVDVEGQEPQVFTGGHQTIKQASKVIVLLEIHPEVLQRNQHSPEQLFEAAESIRPFQWRVPTRGGKLVDRTRPFNEQFELQQYDVIGVYQ